MTQARDKANIPVLNFASKGIDDNADATAITIDSGEDVGIGNTSPFARLVVQGANNENTMVVNTIGTSPNYIFDVRDDGTSVFRIIGSGNVGIGTTSPARQLTVSGSASPVIAIRDTGTSGSPSLFFGDSSADNVGKIQYNNSNNSLAFEAGASEVMRLASGKVAIGKTTVDSEFSRLMLFGSSPGTSSAGQLGIQGSETTGAINTGAGIGFKGHNGAGNRNFGDLKCQKENGSSGDNLSYMSFSTRDASGIGERLRISSDGKVGIGTTVPSEKLDVNGTIKATRFVGGGLNPYRNIIINGDMSIAQRATSKTGITSSTFNTVDRWGTGASSAGTWTQSQSTNVPTGQGFATSLKMDCTTAQGTLGANDRLQIYSKFEGQNLQHLKKGTSSAESTTLSFWVKSNKTGTYICELLDNDNNRHIAKSYTISSANTWEKKTITYAGDTSGALDNNTGESLVVYFWLVAGSSFNSGTLATSWAGVNSANRAVGQTNLSNSTANEWYVTGVQLEAVTSASDFEFLPFDVNFQRCKRYFQNLAPPLNNVRMGIGENKTNAISGVYIHFEPEMRSTPSMSATAANTFSLYHSATDRVATNILFDSKSSKGGNIDVTVSSGILDGGASQFLTNGTSSRLDFSSEL